MGRRRSSQARICVAVRADLAAQLHRAVERRDPDVVRLFDALTAFVTALPPETLAAAGDATSVELVDAVARHWRDLSGHGRTAFLGLVRRLRDADPRIINRIHSPSRRWPLRAAIDVPIVGRPFATVSLDAWHAAAAVYRRVRGARHP